MLKVILFKDKDQSGANDDAVPVNVEHAPGTSVAQARETEGEFRKYANKLRSAQGLTQLYIGDFEANPTVADVRYLKSVSDKMLKRDNEGTQEDFRRVATFLRDGNAVFSEMMKTYGDPYLAAIYIMSARPSHSQINISFIPKRANNRDGGQIATYYRHSTTELDLEANTFKEAIAKDNYVKDECFINCIYDFYADNLLRTDEKRNVITRASILATIGKTEESVKEGLSIEDVLPFLKSIVCI